MTILNKLPLLSDWNTVGEIYCDEMYCGTWRNKKGQKRSDQCTTSKGIHPSSFQDEEKVTEHQGTTIAAKPR